MSLFDQVTQQNPINAAAPLAAVPLNPVQLMQMQQAQGLALPNAPKAKRQPPEAWGNISYKAGDTVQQLRNKYIRIEKEVAEEAYILNAMEKAYAKYMEVEGNVSDDFEFKMKVTLTLTAANRATKSEITGDLEMADEA